MTPGLEQELLRRYVEQNDAQAFRELVENHRDMVFSVCKRILRNAADAEDAAQNSFLQLARKARRLKAPIAGWLHHIAVQISINMHKQNAARTARETKAAALRICKHEPTWDELQGAIDEVIARLPERLRIPVILHYLEGRKQEEIAAELGVTQSAVSKRLAQGIEALRKRLTKSGAIIPAVALASLLAAHSTEATPATLTVSMGKMAFAGLASCTKTTATLGGIAVVKWGIVTAVAATAIVTGGVVAQRALTEEPKPPAAVVQEAPKVVAPEVKPQGQILTGTVLLPDGNPAADAVVKLFYCHDDAGYGSQWLTETKTDGQGEFEMAQPDFEPPALVLGRSYVGRRYLVAYHSGNAPTLKEVDPTGKTRDYAMKLAPGCSVLCKVLDQKGAPVTDAKVQALDSGDVPEILGLTGLSFETVKSMAREIFGRGTTDDAGQVTLNDLPVSHFLFQAYHQEKGMGYQGISLQGESTGLAGLLGKIAGRNALTIRLAGGVTPLAGRVVFGDTGKPAVGMLVCGIGVAPGASPPLWWGTTDAAGNFRIAIFEGAGRCEGVRVFDPSRRPAYASARLSWQRQPVPPGPVQLTMPRGSSLVVKARDLRSRRPLPGAVLRMWLAGIAQTDEQRVCDAQGEAAWCANERVTVATSQPPRGYRQFLPLDTASLDLTTEIVHLDINMDVVPCVDIPVLVKAPDGQPPGITTICAAIPGVRRAAPFTTERTNAQGRGLLRDLPVGREVTIYACRGREAPQRSAAAKFVLQPVEDPGLLEIQLQPTPVAEIALRDDKGNPVQGRVGVGLVDGPFFTEGESDKRDPQATIAVPCLLPDTDYVLSFTITTSHGWVSRVESLPLGSWRFGKNEEHPKLALTYPPQRRPAPPPPPKPRTEEDFKQDCKALGAVWSKDDPVEKNLTWHALKAGLALANAKTLEIKPFRELLGETDFVVNGIAFGKDKVWLGTNKGLFAWDRKDMFWTRFAVDGKFIEFPVKELSLTDTGKPASAGKLSVTIEEGAKPRKFEYDTKAQTWQELH